MTRHIPVFAVLLTRWQYGRGKHPQGTGNDADLQPPLPFQPAARIRWPPG